MSASSIPVDPMTALVREASNASFTNLTTANAFAMDSGLAVPPGVDPNSAAYQGTHLHKGC